MAFTVSINTWLYIIGDNACCIALTTDIIENDRREELEHRVEEVSQQQIDDLKRSIVELTAGEWLCRMASDAILVINFCFL